MDKGRAPAVVIPDRVDAQFRKIREIFAGLPDETRDSLLEIDFTKAGPLLAAGQELLAALFGPGEVNDPAAIAKTIAAAKKLAASYAAFTADPADDEWVNGILSWLTPEMDTFLAETIAWLLGGGHQSAIQSAPPVQAMAGKVDPGTLAQLLTWAVDIAGMLYGLIGTSKHRQGAT